MIDAVFGVIDSGPRRHMRRRFFFPGIGGLLELSAYQLFNTNRAAKRNGRNIMATEYKKHLKRGTIRAIVKNLPMPKTTGLGDTDCNQRGYEQDVTTNTEKVTCTKCLAKLANVAARKS